MSMWHLKIYLSKTKLLNFYINSALPTDFSVSVHVNTFVSLAQILSLKSLLTPFLSHSLTSIHRGAFCKKSLVGTCIVSLLLGYCNGFLVYPSCRCLFPWVFWVSLSILSSFSVPVSSDHSIRTILLDINLDHITLLSAHFNCSQFIQNK